MTIKTLKSLLPDYAKDMKVNLETVLTEQGSPDLSEKQIAIVAYACALTARSKTVIEHITLFAKAHLNQQELNGAATAFSVMTMNNIYYRFVHMASNQEYMKRPSQLKMDTMASPGIEITDFELAAIAVSTINGCGLCIDTHEKKLKAAGVSADAIQSAIRIGAVLYSVSLTLN